MQTTHASLDTSETKLIKSTQRAASTHLARHSALLQSRAEVFGLSTLQRLKLHRELYSAFRDLLVRYDVSARSFPWSKIFIDWTEIWTRYN